MRIIAESTLQLSNERAKELNIDVAEYPLFINGEQYPASMDMSIDDKEKLRSLLKDKNNRVTTSGLNYSDVKNIYDQNKENKIISMHQSFNNSKATGEVLRKLTRDLSETHDIHLVDTGKMATAYTILVLEAAKAVQSGCSFEELTELIEKNKSNSGQFGVLYDLFFLKRAGRIGYAKAFIGTAMKIIPLIRDDKESGSLKSIGKAKNHIQANQKFIKILETEMAEKKSNKISFVITYCGDHEKEPLHFKKLVEEQTWEASIEIHYTNHSNLPHEGPDFYEIGYVIL